MKEKTVVYFTRYERSGPSSRLRSYQYKPFLEKTGVKVIMCPLFNDEYIEELYDSKRSISKVNVIFCYINRIWQLLRYVRKSHVIIVEKEFFPYLPAWAESILFTFKIDYWIDIDDAIFHYYDELTHPVLKRLCGNKMDVVFSRSQIVLAGNEYLKKRAKSSGASRVEVYPTVIDTKHYRERCSKVECVNEKVVVGWIGSPSTVKYFEPILPVLDDLASQLEFKLTIVGSNRFFDLKNIKPEYREWSEAHEVELISSFDIGIMSLQDSLFEKGKCGYKLIQYFGCAKPVVASPVGVNSQIVDHGVNGYLAGSDQEWMDYLTILIKDREKRVKMGMIGFEKVESQYDLNVTGERLIELLNDV